MKQLQNNFTTPEQSRQLLELGLPVDSADCVLVRNLYFPKGEYEIKVLDGKYSRFIEMHDTWEIIPCWSVGRLIEIYEIVGENAGQCLSTDENDSIVEKFVQLYEENVTMLNFSKLEE